MNPSSNRSWFRALPSLAAALALISCEKSATTPASPVAASANAPRAADSATDGLDPADQKKLLAAVDALAGPLKDRAKPYEILYALGNLYYDNNRYLEAVDSFRQALALAQPIEAEADALRAKGVKPAPVLPAECKLKTPDVAQAQVAAAAKSFAASDPARALRCDLEAISTLNDLRSRHADGLYLIGQPEAAREEHLRVLARVKDAPESLFFVGAITLEQSNGDKIQLEEGKRYWKRLLEVAPNHPRAALVKESLPKADVMFAPRTGDAPAEEPAQAAPSAAMPSQLPPGHPPLGGQGSGPAAPSAPAPAVTGGPTPEMVQAVAQAAAQTERTPELEKSLDALTTQAEADLDAGRYQQARDEMVRVMPMRPNEPRVAADLGAAMAGLGKLEMAERVLSRALAGDPHQARALYEMGKLLAARKDVAGAREKFLAVKSADAKFATAHGVDAELGKLK